MSVTLILGGARSGKSSRAERLAEKSFLPVTYIATAPQIDGDSQWSARIERHREGRNGQWQTIEEEIDIAHAIKTTAGEDRVVIVECLTLWLSNLTMAEKSVDRECENLCSVLRQSIGEVVLVSNEVGMGLVPENEMAREFRDAQGRLNQAVASVADRVEFVVAGLPIYLKGGAGEYCKD